MTRDSGVLAIGVALLLPDDVASAVIEVSRTLALAGSDLVLDRDHAPPHVTLMMAGVDERRVATLARRLGELLVDQPSPNLVPVGTTSLRTGSGRPTLWLNFDPRTLRALHDAVVDTVSGIAVEAVSDGSLRFGGKVPVGESTVRWVLEFAHRATREHFRPHITLGRGDSPPNLQLRPFPAKQVVVARIGAHGTIPEILEAFEFAPSKTS